MSIEQPTDQKIVWMTPKMFGSRLNPPLTGRQVSYWITKGDIRAHNISLSDRPSWRIAYTEIARIQKKLELRKNYGGLEQ